MMAKAVSGVIPTRMELFKLRQRINLAQKGHDLLKEKMDALVIEFFDIIKKTRVAREKALEQLSFAHKSLFKCMAIVGIQETKQASHETKRGIQLDMSARYVMGVSVPVIEIGQLERDPLMRGYSLHTTSSVLDDTSREFERALKLLIELAELEESARAIGRELEKTKRRVNALEYILIPKLKAAVKFISMRLDEIERENFSRLKRVKALLEGRR